MKMKNRFCFIAVLWALFFMGSSAYAQYSNRGLTSAQEMCLIVVSKIDVPEIKYVEVEPPKYWTNGIMNQVGFSQVSLTNWASGGVGSIAMNAYVDAHANYKKGLMIWENRANLAYGFVSTFGEQFKKSDDRIQLESKWGYGIANKIYASAVFNFRTQFANGYKYGATKADNKRISTFMAPGYITVGVGADWKPFDFLSVNVAPLTGNFVIVGVEELRKSYGNAEDQAVRTEIGAQFKGDFKKNFNGWGVGTALTLFWDYLYKSATPQVYWDFNFDFKINKFLSAGLRTNLIYDQKIMKKDDSGVDVPRGVQFKEALSLSFVYTIGNYQKKK